MADSGFLELEKGTASPGAGATDFDRFYVDPADNKFTRKKDDGSTEKFVSNTTPITAADVANVPAGDIAATNVQAALNELDTEKLALADVDTNNTPNTVPIRDGSGDFSMNKLYTVQGVIANNAGATVELDTTQMRLTDAASIVRAHVTPGRLDLRDTAGNNASVEINAGTVYYSNSGAGHHNFGGKKLTQVGNATASLDAVNLQQLSYTDLYYVSNSGDDVTGTGSIAKPYQTIAAAIAAAPAYSTIFLMPGGYNEPTVVLPDTISIKGFSPANTTIINGISHTSTATNVGIMIENVTYGTATIDTSLCVNGTITFLNSNGFLNITAMNLTSIITYSQGLIYGGTMASGTMSIDEVLMVSSYVVTGGFVIFSNCRFVDSVDASGASIVRMKDCELYGATEFMNGVSGTPTWQVDVATDYLGGYTGTLTKVLLEKIPEYKKNLISENITIPSGYTMIKGNVEIGSGISLTIESGGALITL